VSSLLLSRKPNAISDINFANDIYLHFVPSRIRDSSVSIVSRLLVGCQNIHGRGSTFVPFLDRPYFLRVHRDCSPMGVGVERSEPEVYHSPSSSAYVENATANVSS
jgi:hypothetical protein